MASDDKDNLGEGDYRLWKFFEHGKAS